MQTLLRISSGIDRFNGAIGKLTYWLSLGLVLIGAFNALARFMSRYIGIDLSSNAYIEAQWYIFSLIFLLGSAYTLERNGHVRVDAIYGRLKPKSKAWINLIGTLVFLLPFSILMIWVSIPAVRNSWSVWEVSPDPDGLPRYPIKTIIPLAFVLMMIQGISEFIKHLAVIRDVLPVDMEEEAQQSEGL